MYVNRLFCLVISLSNNNLIEVKVLIILCILFYGKCIFFLFFRYLLVIGGFRVRGIDLRVNNISILWVILFFLIMLFVRIGVRSI